ncbi:MAG: transcriptional regulator GutM [Dermabacter sp.]|nr:transcriptional regulator GutM [Dermabacter sp.]
MSGLDWAFPAALFVALVASGFLTFLQQRRYVRAMNEAAASADGPGDALVTGRGRGILRGAVVVLIVDRARGEITSARAMVGATVFARFTERPDLCGPVDAVTARVRGKHLSKALAAAMAQLPAAPADPRMRERTLARARAARAMRGSARASAAT